MPGPILFSHKISHARRSFQCAQILLHGALFHPQCPGELRDRLFPVDELVNLADVILDHIAAEERTKELEAEEAGRRAQIARTRNAVRMRVHRADQKRRRIDAAARLAIGDVGEDAADVGGGMLWAADGSDDTDDESTTMNSSLGAGSSSNASGSRGGSSSASFKRRAP